jgi:hypothetical protein
LGAGIRGIRPFRGGRRHFHLKQCGKHWKRCIEVLGVVFDNLHVPKGRGSKVVEQTVGFEKNVVGE